jgi:hypothetical protein
MSDREICNVVAIQQVSTGRWWHPDGWEVERVRLALPREEASDTVFEIIERGDAEAHDLAIVELSPRVPGEDEPFIGVDDPRKLFGACSHGRGVELEVEQRTARCRICKGIVDPFDALVDLSKDSYRHFYGIRQAKAERARLADEIRDLKRRVGNEKAKLRRAVAKRKKECGPNV